MTDQPQAQQPPPDDPIAWAIQILRDSVTADERLWKRVLLEALESGTDLRAENWAMRADLERMANAARAELDQERSARDVALTELGVARAELGELREALAQTSAALTQSRVGFDEVQGELNRWREWVLQAAKPDGENVAAVKPEDVAPFALEQRIHNAQRHAERALVQTALIDPDERTVIAIRAALEGFHKQP